ncbi:alpha carbonic anhydrase 2-like [Arabidopsis lyrata subsp. lyrata]|uniref:alpha carbonic anhydrase 2-like n=1 Tax=Arabidopsis lyrata subsp. lyrata TaxID=81972 RepID=UPI000A29CCA9|nr:alpha carbonic anhydrase 2-like [Arabidopsis lyrata subsp. lyrata]|eukprot:XP_020883808.1 alpha carbonic anhydrase 2-like [Arabidopsis lyrata subsp. lyrata]
MDPVEFCSFFIKTIRSYIFLLHPKKFLRSRTILSSYLKMDKSSIRCFFFVVLTIFGTTIVSCSSAAKQDREVEDESEFSYELNKENGPAKWGKLKPEWKMCGKGEMQSPIDLMNKRVKLVSHLGKLTRNYKPSNATLKNRGHDMMLKFGEEGSAGSIKINGTEYKLLQLHWHSPSEHTINGRRFALELHMVHESKNGSMAVVTVLYKIGKPDSFLGLLEHKMAAITDQNDAKKNVVMIDPSKIKIESRNYYRYIGSLTTPPCTQNVTWTIIRTTRTVTKSQVNLLRVAVHDDSNSNARPVQPTNKREIHLYRPKSL